MTEQVVCTRKCTPKRDFFHQSRLSSLDTTVDSLPSHTHPVPRPALPKSVARASSTTQLGPGQKGQGWTSCQDAYNSTSCWPSVPMPFPPPPIPNFLIPASANTPLSAHFELSFHHHSTPLSYHILLPAKHHRNTKHTCKLKHRRAVPFKQ